MLTVAYTGRPELDNCRRLVRAADVTIVNVPIIRPVDLGISAAGTHIFTPDEIALARLGIVNLHLAPLPEYRGRFSATHAILNGDRWFGVTLHYVDEGLDTGPIIAKGSLPIMLHDTAGTVRARARRRGELLFAQFLPLLIDAARRGKRLPATPQDESRAHYYDRHSLPAPVPGDRLLERALAC